jgi:hypothetical protein
MRAADLRGKVVMTSHPYVMMGLLMGPVDGLAWRLAEA